jgi:hypothetical protein
MSANDLSYLLSYAYDRAMVSADPADVRPIRRAFGKAIRALASGDIAPALLLVNRWP